MSEPKPNSELDLDRSFALLYEDLRRRARLQRRQWQSQNTLNTTALIHEAYLKLARGGTVDLQGRTHFLALASRVMRQVLVDYARERKAAKRGGGRRSVPLNEVKLGPGADSGVPEVLLALEESLALLEEDNPRHARVVECRFFAGMTIEETASALDLSPATVKRSWAIARTWLYCDMSERFGPRTE